MKSFTVIAALMGAVLAAPSLNLARGAAKGFTIARLDPNAETIISKYNTLNGTYHSKESKTVKAGQVSSLAAADQPVPLEFVNNLGDGVKAYITGRDSQGRVAVIKGNGDIFYPSSGGSREPVPISEDISIQMPGQGQTFRMNLPIKLDGGRIYFAQGDLEFKVVIDGTNRDSLVEPSAADLGGANAQINWGFVELTYDDRGLTANLTYVDFVGMILSMAMEAGSGESTLVKGLAPGALPALCDGLQKVNDGGPWAKMCIADQAGQPRRVLSPNYWNDLHAEDWTDYWTDYINRVWDQYSGQTLTIDAQGVLGPSDCHSDGNTLNCNDAEPGFSKPDAKAIFGCNDGSLANAGSDKHKAVAARLCAAINRATLLVDGGDHQPTSKDIYYQSEPQNQYSRVIHENEVDGKGYAFSYDDVGLSGDESSGLVFYPDPSVLRVWIGGWSS